MASDPGFIFYPGDYLRDTQCLSEKSQVAYDRIMCEHMRNICLTQAQLNFFTKRLSDDEKSELAQVIVSTPEGFYISWVADSIKKRREYSESRRNNRSGHSKKGKNISSTYDNHMDNEIENESIIEKEIAIEKHLAPKEDLIKLPFETPGFKELWNRWVLYRKEIKKPYRSVMSQQAALKQLSKFDEPFSMMLIERSIANQWQGLIFEKTQEEYLNYKSNGTIRTTPEGKRIPKWGTAADALRRSAEEIAKQSAANVV